MIDVPDNFFEFAEHLQIRQDRWIEAGDSWGRPGLKDCVLFMLTEAREVHRLAGRNLNDDNLAIATEAFDCLMMGTLALGYSEYYLKVSFFSWSSLSDMGKVFLLQDQELGRLVEKLVACGLDALDEVMRLDARYHRNDSKRKPDVFATISHIAKFARIAAGLIVKTGHSPVEVARRKLALMDEKRGIAEE